MGNCYHLKDKKEKTKTCHENKKNKFEEYAQSFHKKPLTREESERKKVWMIWLHKSYQRTNFYF